MAILRAAMAHDTHGADAAHHAAGPHPELPPVQDEAADTPLWLPVTGLVLLAVFALFVLWRGARPTEIPQSDVAADAAAAEPAAAEPAAE